MQTESAHRAEYGHTIADVRAWERDNTMVCVCCGSRWYTPALGPLDQKHSRAILEDDGAVVCLKCEPEYIEAFL